MQSIYLALYLSACLSIYLYPYPSIHVASSVYLTVSHYFSIFLPVSLFCDVSQSCLSSHTHCPPLRRAGLSILSTMPDGVVASYAYGQVCVLLRSRHCDASVYVNVLWLINVSLFVFGLLELELFFSELMSLSLFSFLDFFFFELEWISLSSYLNFLSWNEYLHFLDFFIWN